MNKYKRIFIIGHPGAGKALLAKTLAEKLGWQFIDADLGLESRVGRTISEILGQESEESFYHCESEILAHQLKQENIVVTTDASIVLNEKNRQLLSEEFVVYLKVSTPVQLDRTSHQPLLPMKDWKLFFDQLHAARDQLYEQMASMSVDSDDSALEKHVSCIADVVSENKEIKKK